ncbi:hypothetical protein [Paracoccus sp. (in: a-proteobacteria)]|uniref:hypothetical protein n=1 Tax=Paracoccus sp. TaxID=267 RepID=UPI0026DF3AE0|nr:hypothetical protein [Paracoccus sp. (in: a-proteobacteria)]MDO5647273.1 hypothetical protein [Paracoccus sp. (in: a-proteobacteria)]
MTQHHAPASADERRALSRDELELADQARNPALSNLSDRELSDLISRLRDRRNRARDIGNRQSRNDQGNAGTMSKHSFLNEALERARAERDSRGTECDSAAEDAEDEVTQKELAEKAMALKDENAESNPMMEDGSPLHPSDPDADPGKKALAETERDKYPSGAFEHSGELPQRKRSGGPR